MKKSRAKFLKELYKDSNEFMKAELLRAFPNLIEVKVVIGNWYWIKIGDGKMLICPTSKPYIKEGASNQRVKGYGFNLRGDYNLDGFGLGNNEPVEATKEEVVKALNKELTRRGYTLGTKYFCPTDINKSLTVEIQGDLTFYMRNDKNYITDGHGGFVFYKGLWAIKTRGDSSIPRGSHLLRSLGVNLEVWGNNDGEEWEVKVKRDFKNSKKIK